MSKKYKPDLIARRNNEVICCESRQKLYDVPCLRRATAGRLLRWRSSQW